MSLKFDREWSENIVIKDGRQILLRPVTPADKPIFADGVRRYSDHSLYRRFLSAKSMFSPAKLSYLTEGNGYDHFAILAIEVVGGREIGAGVALFIRYPRQPDTADCAIFVGDPYQRFGLGRALITSLCLAARERDVACLGGEMFSDNDAMFHLVDTLPYASGWNLDGRIAQFVIHLDRPMPEHEVHS